MSRAGTPCTTELLVTAVGARKLALAYVPRISVVQRLQLLRTRRAVCITELFVSAVGARKLALAYVLTSR